jgi:hypothetical protein
MPFLCTVNFEPLLAQGYNCAAFHVLMWIYEKAGPYFFVFQTRREFLLLEIVHGISVRIRLTNSFSAIVIHIQLILTGAVSRNPPNVRPPRDSNSGRSKIPFFGTKFFPQLLMGNGKSDIGSFAD